jgi:hypothetical protein
MKRTVITCGIISGLIVGGLMLISIGTCYNDENFEGSMWLGYASMLLAFSLVFVGIKNFRDKYNGGVISFKKAFLTGLYITLISSTMYVIAWLIDYYIFVPDFMDQYGNYMLRTAKEKGVSAAEYQQEVEKMQSYKDMYKNPLFVILFTYFEILPLGIVISIIAALILKRKNTQPLNTVNSQA